MNSHELKKINYFDKNVYSVRERVKNALSHTLYTFLSKYILFFFIHIGQKYSMKKFEIFPKACTHIFKNLNFRLQGLQIEAFQQRN